MIWRHNFKMAAMTSFHAEKCCRLVSGHTASAQRLSVAQPTGAQLPHPRNDINIES